ncbi:hypothetical protein MPSEU_000612100 [Mayamaea pseudoterrestris]|nr:hypothetical protein MPSEU_000612100 [Mayamaea pseudoterrestris]
MKFSLVLAAALCALSSAFAPISRPSSSTVLSATLRGEVDSIGNNIAVKELLRDVEQKQLLSKVAASGLLSKASKAGIKLSSLEPFLELAASNPDILVLVEASGPELLPLLPTIVDVAPAALPLLAGAVGIPSAAFPVLGLGLLASAYGAVAFIPDDSVLNVALQTTIVGASLVGAIAAFAGGAILGQLIKK